MFRSVQCNHRAFTGGRRSRGRERSEDAVTAVFGDGSGQEARDAGGPREPQEIGFLAAREGTQILPWGLHPANTRIRSPGARSVSTLTSEVKRVNAHCVPALGHGDRSQQR